MLNVEQERYIQNLKITNPGLADDFLRSTLEGAGWPETEVAEALSMYHKPHETEVTVTPVHRKRNIIILGSIVTGILLIALSGLILRQTEQESLVKDMTQVDEATLVQFETKLNEIQKLYSQTLNIPEMLPILEKTKFLDFYPDVLGNLEIEIAKVDIRRSEEILEYILNTDDAELDGMKQERQERAETDLKKSKEALALVKENMEEWKQEKRKELEADLTLRRNTLEKRNPAVEQVIVMLQSEEPSLATEIDAVKQGMPIQDTSSKFKYLLLKKLSKLAVEAGEPAYDFTEAILLYDPEKLNEESYYVFQAILAIIDERYSRITQEQDLHYIYNDEIPDTIADGLDDGLFKLGTNICSQEIVQALMIFADTVAESVGDASRSICRESNTTFAVFYPRELSGKIQYFCTGTGVDGKRVLPYGTGLFRQDTTKSFCIE